MIDAREAADAVLQACEGGTRLSPFTDRDPTFDVARAYDVAGHLRGRREDVGEPSIGRKIGFTNRAVWTTMKITEPIWGDVYATTDGLDVRDGMSAATLCLPRLPELKIEPEIVFGLAASPTGTMTDEALLDCIAWMALGFELVHSLYPGWRFRAPDAIADGGLHAALVVGPHLRRTDFPLSLTGDLQRFTATLTSGERDEVVVTGSGANVLGSPLRALSYLAQLIDANPSWPPLRPGEVITTGTLTAAPSVGRRETWTASVAGLDLPALTLSLT